LAAKYSAPNLNNGGGGTKDVVDVGKLGRRDYNGNGGGGLMMEVGRLDVEEESDVFEEIIVGKGRRFGRRLLDDDGAEVEEEDVKQQDEQQQVIEVAEMMMSMEEEEKEDVKAPVERQEEEEETTIMPIQQIGEVEAEDSVIEDATDDVVEETEEPVKEETAPVQVEESSSIQPIVETPLSDEKQPSPPLRKRQCLLLLMLLMIIAATIIGIVFGTSPGNSSSEIDSTTQFPTSRCSAKEKYVSIRHYTHKPLLPTDDATTRRRRIEVSAAPSTDSTWSLKDSCSGEVLMKCEPCLFSDEGDIAFEFIEKKKNRIGGPDPEGEDIRRLLLNGDDSSGMCVPDDREYSFEVRKTDGTDEDRCCNFDVTTFFVTFGNVTVVDSAHTIIDSGFASTLFSNEGVDPCPTTDSPSLSPISSSPSAGPPPEAQCIAAGDDMNLCLAIDMSGSLCNRNTGYECLGCVLEAFTASICNKDGVEISTCCGNFHNVKEFAKRLISVFETIPSEQSYSIVGFATNASFVSDLVPLSVDAFSSLDSLAYSGGRTNHAAAISSCQQTLSNSDAVERKNMIILITDGNPTEPDEETTAINDAIAAAIQAKEAGSILIPVMLTTTSIDNNTTDYMTEISSEGLFFNTSLSTLDIVEESLLSKVLC